MRSGCGWGPPLGDVMIELSFAWPVQYACVDNNYESTCMYVHALGDVMTEISFACALAWEQEEIMHLRGK